MNEFDQRKETIEALRRNHVSPEPESSKQERAALAAQASFESEVDKTCESMSVGGVPPLPRDPSLDRERHEAITRRMRDKSLSPRMRDSMARYADRLNRRMSGLRWS